MRWEPQLTGINGCTNTNSACADYIAIRTAGVQIPTMGVQIPTVCAWCVILWQGLQVRRTCPGEDLELGERMAATWIAENVSAWCGGLWHYGKACAGMLGLP